MNGPRAWSVICVPVEENPGSVESKNKSGLRIVLTDGEEEREVSRVAYVRRNSKNPEISFEDQLAAEVGKAQEAATIVNDLLDDFDRLQAEAVEKAREAIREALGRAPAWNAKPV